MSEPSKAPTPRARRRSWLVIAGLAVVGFVVAAAVVFLAVNLGTTEPPPPRYTAADLPALPPPGENGWVILRDAPPPGGARADEARARASEALSSKQSAADFASAKVDPDAAMTTALDRCRHAYRAPRFVDACTMDPQATCPHLVVHHCHRLLAHEALALAATARENEAGALTDRMLAVAIEHAQTGRGLVGQAVAQRNLEQTLELLERLQDWLPPEALSAPLGRLAAFDPDSLRIELALVGEYLVMMRAFEEMKHASAEERWLFDRAATQKVVDEAFARAENGGPLLVTARTDGPLWWFHNPVGKLLLSALAPMDNTWDDMMARDRALRDQRSALLGRSPNGGSEK